MNELKKHAVSLTLIMALVAIKFIFVPIMDWQDEKIAKSALLERKLVKIEQLLENKDAIEQQQININEQLNQLTEIFHPHEKAEMFKLRQQKLIETAMDQNNLDLKSIGWKGATSINDAPLQTLQLEYSFSGRAEIVVEYILTIMSKQQFSDFATLNLTFSQRKYDLPGKLTVRMRQNYYMRLPTQEVALK